MDDSKKSLQLNCTLDKDGTVTCDITKEDFKNLLNENIKPQKVVLEIE